MPGIKRKASRASPYESPSKITKETSTTTVSRTLSVLRKETTVSRVPLPVPTWPSLKGKTGEKKDSEKEPLPLPRWPTLKRKATEKKDSATPGTSGDLSPPPGLRRSATLPVAEEESKVSKSSLSSKKTLSKKGSKVGELITVPSLPKTSSVVDGDDTVTTLKRLPSGSSIGKTTSFSGAPPAIRKELSKVPSMRKSTSSTGKAKESGTVEISLEKTPSLTKSLSKGSMRKGRSVGSSAGTVDGDGGMSSAVPLPPGGMMEIVFSFDTTGSMYSCLDQVRGRIQDMIQRLQADIPGIRIAVVAHGDYCDRDKYVIEWIDFGATVPELCKFVKEIDRTYGGDFEECYELVLRRVQSVLSWTPGSQRSLVVIGDATPHESRDNPDNIDWREECQALKKMGVKVYAVQALNELRSDSFYKDMAKMTFGKHLKLDQFSNIFDMIMAICYRERGSELFEAFEEEVRERYEGAALDKDLEGLFGTLRGDTPPTTLSSPAVSREPPIVMTADLGPTVLSTTPVTASKTYEISMITVGAMTSPTPVTTLKTSDKQKKKSSKRKRESVDDYYEFENGIRGTLEWSEWELAMAKVKPVKKSPIWKPRAPSPGYRRSTVFRHNHGSRAIYEIGIKAPWSTRRRVFVLYYKITKGFSDKMRLDKFLLQNPTVKEEVDDVISRDGKIFIRRGIFKSTSDDVFKNTINYVKNKFDYAWNTCRKGTTKVHRTVRKTKFIMAGVHVQLFNIIPRKRIVKKPKKTTKAKQAAKTKNVTKSYRGIKGKTVKRRGKSTKANKNNKGKKPDKIGTKEKTTLQKKTTTKAKLAAKKKSKANIKKAKSALPINTAKAKLAAKKKSKSNIKKAKSALPQKTTKAKLAAKTKSATKIKNITKTKITRKGINAAKTTAKVKSAAKVKALLKDKRGAKTLGGTRSRK